MALADDIAIDRATGAITHVSGSTRYPIIDFHRALGDMSDDEISTGDDEYDMIDDDASERSTDNIITLVNGFFIDDTLAQFLYDGSIIQKQGDEIYDGITVYAPAGIYIDTIQNGALATNFWTTGLNADAAAGISHRFMIKVRSDGVDIDQRRLVGTTREFGKTSGEFVINGTIRGNNTMAFTGWADDLNNETLIATIAAMNDITVTEGLRLIDVDNDGTPEEYCDEWNKGGNSENDLYERIKWLTRRGTSSTVHGVNGALHRGITHSLAYDGEAGTAPATNDEIVWGTAIAYNNEASGPFTVGEAIHEDTATPVWKGRILAIDDNGTTGTLIVDIEFGVVTTGDSFTGQGSSATADANGTPTVVVGGGTLRVLAIDDDGTTGNIYVQVVKGTAPADNDILYDDLNVANTVTVNGSPVARSISTPWIGISTGSNIIGSYGFGIEVADLTVGSKLTDLAAVLNLPPNLVTLALSGLLDTGNVDRLLVGPESGGVLNRTQMTLNGALSGGAVTSVVINGSIPDNMPATGTIRILRASGKTTRHPYSARAGSTITITAHDFSSDNAANGAGAFVTYFDGLVTAALENIQWIYDSDQPMYIKLRNGDVLLPIKTWITTTTVGSGGGALTASRITDK